jgi:hypothetical protein
MSVFDFISVISLLALGAFAIGLTLMAFDGAEARLRARRARHALPASAVSAPFVVAASQGAHGVEASRVGDEDFARAPTTVSGWDLG